MNSTLISNLSNRNNSTTRPLSTPTPDYYLINILNFLYTIGYIYIVPVIAVVGFCLNLISLLVFFNPKLTGDIYKYFVTKTIAEMIFLALGALYPFFYCSSCPTYLSLGWAIIVAYGSGFVLTTTYAYSGFCELAIVYDRLAILYQNRLVFKFNAWLLTTVMFFVSALLFMPTIFSTYVAQLMPGKYIFFKTDFGKSNGYLWYAGLVLVVVNIFTFTALIFLNSLLVKKFKSFVVAKRSIVLSSKSALSIINSKRKSTVKPSTVVETALPINNPASVLNTNNNDVLINPRKSAPGVVNSRQHDDPQRRIHLMVIVLSFVFIGSRTFQTIAAILYSYYSLSGLQLPAAFYTYNFITIVIQFVASTFNFFIYFNFNRQFKDCLIEMGKYVWRF
jgi:hypothetical protein